MNKHEPGWSAVRRALETIEEFAELAADLAAKVEDGTLTLSEEDKRGLGLALQIFEIQADRLRLQLPGPDTLLEARSGSVP